MDEHGAAIRMADPDRQSPIEYRADAWRGRLPAGDLEPVDDRFGGTINRPALRAHARETDGGDAAARRRLLIAALLLGAGTTNRHYGNLERTLAAEHLNDVLGHSWEALANGDLGQAYRTMARMQGHGTGYPFFTKWLWAAGVATGAAPAPLIYDRNVRRALRSLGWPGMQRQRRDQRWQRYCDDAAHIVDALDMSSEHAELWLFQRA